MPQYNAKTLPLGDPYTAASNYGVTFDNAAEKFRRIWADRNTEDGGSKQIFNKFKQWASPEQIKARGGNPNDTQWKLINDAIKTGKVDPRIKPETLLRGLGTGLSETARYQQHKPVSMFERIAGPLLTIGAAAIPVIGPYAGAAVGGYMGQRHGGGLLGGLLGAAGGYMGGKSIMNAGGVSGIYNSAKTGLSNLFGGGGFSNPAALGISGGNLGLDFASAPGAFAGAAPIGIGNAANLGLGAGNLALNFASGPMPSVAATNLNSVSHVANEIGRSANPASLYQPESLSGPMPGPTRNPLTTAGRVVSMLGGLDNPAPTSTTTTGAGSFGGPAKPMVPHGARMIPMAPLRYPTNPFMARIV